MFATGVTMGLAEWIIDDTCLVTRICFACLDFEKSRRIDNMCENNYHNRPWVWVGREDQLSKI